eukprot:gene9032-9968_t
MIPTMFVKEHPYARYASMALPPAAGSHHHHHPHPHHVGVGPPTVHLRPGEYPGVHHDAQGLLAVSHSALEIPPNANIDAILQVHRRKMLRRAANRRSAQLSRARKKAHLEDLKAENSRLQRLVDVLDSQPELIFCVTSQGRITYVSERTINFIKIIGEDSDEDPVHLSQILAKESVDSVLDAIARLKVMSSNKTTENDLNLLFSVKEVFFQDASGQQVMGYLRCSKVHRRTTFQELANSVVNGNGASVGGGNSDDPSTVAMSTSYHSLPPAKKAKTRPGSSINGNGGGSSSSQFHHHQHQQHILGLPIAPTPCPSLASESAKLDPNNDNMDVVSNGNSLSNGGTGTGENGSSSNADWNLSNFKLLTDCVSSLTKEDLLSIPPKAIVAAHNGHGNGQLSNADSNDNNSTANSTSNSGSGGNTAVNSKKYHKTSSSKSISSSAGTSYGAGVVVGVGGENSVTTMLNDSITSSSGSNNGYDDDDEFVCVIRTADEYFSPHRSEQDLRMFSVLSPASIAAHDLIMRQQHHQQQRGGQGGVTSNNGDVDCRQSSPHDSDSSGVAKHTLSSVTSTSGSGSFSGQTTKNNGTSSETGSEDAMNENENDNETGETDSN